MDRRHKGASMMRAKSFRDEDYTTRRVFLRSYPLHWKEEENKEETTMATTEKTPMKKIFLSVFHWGEEKVLILRKFKSKITIYVIACIPAHLKPPSALTSA